MVDTLANVAVAPYILFWWSVEKWEEVNMSWFEGKKTFIGLLAAAVLGILAALKVLDASSELFEVIIILIFLFTGVSYRLAMKPPPTE